MERSSAFLRPVPPSLPLPPTPAAAAAAPAARGSPARSLQSGPTRPLSPPCSPHLSLLHLLQLHAAGLHCLIPALNVHLSPPRVILVSSLQATGGKGGERLDSGQGNRKRCRTVKELSMQWVGRKNS